MVNTFVLYKRFLEDNGIKSKDIILEYDFHQDYTLDLLGYFTGKNRGLLNLI